MSISLFRSAVKMEFILHTDGWVKSEGLITSVKLTKVGVAREDGILLIFFRVCFGY